MSYSPDLVPNGETKTGTNQFALIYNDSFIIPPTAVNIVEVGLNYEHKIRDYFLKLGITHVHGDSKKLISQQDQNVTVKTHNNLNSYNIGAVIGYKQLYFSGSYGIKIKSFTHKRLSKSYNNITVDYYTIGSKYKKGDYAMSITHFQSNAFGNKHNVTSVGLEYLHIPGITPYIECNYTKYIPAKSMSNKQRYKTRTANILYAGLALRF